MFFVAPSRRNFIYVLFLGQLCCPRLLMLRLPVAFIVSVRQDTTLLTVGIADTHGLDDKKLECLEGTTLNKKII